MKYWLCTLMMLAMAAGSFTIMPTAAAEDSDRDWEKIEEPALRPVKAVGRGFAAFWYQTVQALAAGNERFPILGSVEIFRGFRHGLVEFTEHTATGMAHSQPRDWKQTGTVNTVINEDILLRNAADFATNVAIARVPGNSMENSLLFGSSIWTAQKVLEQSPDNPDKDARLENRVQRARESYLMQVGHRTLTVEDRGRLREEEPSWKRAQREYIGDRADVNPRRDRGGGNLLRLGR
jgi:hypothetical protein